MSARTPLYFSDFISAVIIIFLFLSFKFITVVLPAWSVKVIASSLSETLSVPENFKSLATGSNWITNSGAVLSMVKVMLFSGSLLPALSVEKNAIVWLPSLETLIVAALPEIF